MTAGVTPPPVRRRLRAEDRRRQLLLAARRVFSETGDINATTMRDIGREAGITEAVIYRHFESKEELFLEAILAPLQDTIHRAVEGTFRPATNPEGRIKATIPFIQELTKELIEALPLLGLVLFGDPDKGRNFYRTTMAASMQELGERWTDFYKEYGIDFPGPVVARAVLGMAMMFAIEDRFNPGSFDLSEVSNILTRLIYDGMFPRRTGDSYVFKSLERPIPSQ